MHTVRLSLLTLPLTLAAMSATAQAQPVASEPGPASPTATQPNTTSPPPADAPAPADQPTEAYTRAAKLGYQEYELGNYVEARVRFREAHAAFPNARSLRALGAVEYDLKNYPASVDYLQQALASDVRPLRGKLRADAERLLAMALDYVATYTVILDPAQARLEVDGHAAQLSPESTVMLGVGEHVLTASAEGYRDARRSVTVASGKPDTLSLRLLPVATLPPTPVVAAPPTVAESAPVAPAPKDKPREGLSRRNRNLLYAAAAVLVVAVGTGLAVGLSGREKTGAPSESNISGLPPLEVVGWNGLP